MTDTKPWNLNYILNETAFAFKSAGIDEASNLVRHKVALSASKSLVIDIDSGIMHCCGKLNKRRKTHVTQFALVASH